MKEFPVHFPVTFPSSFLLLVFISGLSNALAFYRSQKILDWSKLAPNFLYQLKLIYVLCKSQTFCARPKYEFHSVNSVYCAGTKSFGAALNAINFLVWPKKFGPAQNFLGPAERRDI